MRTVLLAVFHALPIASFAGLVWLAVALCRGLARLTYSYPL